MERRRFLKFLGAGLVGLISVPKIFETKKDIETSISENLTYYGNVETLNPSDVDAWTVARGFPRKHK